MMIIIVITVVERCMRGQGWAGDGWGKEAPDARGAREWGELRGEMRELRAWVVWEAWVDCKGGCSSLSLTLFLSLSLS